MSKTSTRNTTSKVKRTSKSPRRSLSLSYIPIDHHVYYDGHSFRVRVTSEGNTVSQSTQDKKKALKYRDRLLSKQ
jgi:hypothetical protein